MEGVVKTIKRFSRKKEKKSESSSPVHQSSPVIAYNRSECVKPKSIWDQQSSPVISNTHRNNHIYYIAKLAILQIVNLKIITSKIVSSLTNKA